jgi:hypothetical protein
VHSVRESSWSAARWPSNKDMETTCVPDVATLRWTGCPTSPWRERAAAALNPSAPILLNIGANKGFAASEFLSLFSQRAVGAKRWHRAVVGYGRAHKLGFVDATSCGACGACGARAPERHSRDGGRVHLLELLPSTRTLLRHVIDTLHVHDVVHVHDLAASNVSAVVRVPDSFHIAPAADEKANLFAGGAAATVFTDCANRTDLLLRTEGAARTCRQFSGNRSACASHRVGRTPCRMLLSHKLSHGKTSRRPSHPSASHALRLCARDFVRVCRAAELSLTLTTVDDLMASLGIARVYVGGAYHPSPEPLTPLWSQHLLANAQCARPTIKPRCVPSAAHPRLIHAHPRTRPPTPTQAHPHPTNVSMNVVPPSHQRVHDPRSRAGCAHKHTRRSCLSPACPCPSMHRPICGTCCDWHLPSLHHHVCVGTFHPSKDPCTITSAGSPFCTVDPSRHIT